LASEKGINVLSQETSRPQPSADSPPDPSAASHFNIGSLLTLHAAQRPQQDALLVQTSSGRSKASYAGVTFDELERLSNRYANAMRTDGLERGMHTLVMVRPGVDFLAVVFALFKIGAVPVMIDPGMGIQRVLECLQSADVTGFVGIPLAHVMRKLRPAAFRSVNHAITVGRRWFWGGLNLHKAARHASDSLEPVATRSDECAAILFTSGSTGPAKGVVYEHGMFGAQVREIRDAYGIEPGEVDVPTFPLFGLFSIGMGMTVVIPDMDPSRPGDVDPRRIVQAIRDHHATNTFGSPALWKRVASHCQQHDIKLPSLRRILVAGAPVPYPVIEQLHDALNDEADVYTPYGATESLPVSSIGGREVLGECRDLTRGGAGTCVGRVMPEIELRVIRITDEPIVDWSEDLEVPDGIKGEIVVRGPVVTKAYYGLDAATKLAKICDGGRIWHRIGDIGYRDAQGRIWFCGRKAHRVTTHDGTMFTVPCEAVFNEHPHVARSALVGVGPPGEQTPVIIVEPVPGKFPRNAQVLTFWEELLEFARDNELTRDITIVLFYPSLPVDVRHNAKIHREALAEWAAAELQ